MKAQPSGLTWVWGSKALSLILAPWALPRACAAGQGPRQLVSDPC